MAPENLINDVELLLVEDDDIDAISMTRAFKRKKVKNPVVRVKDGLEALSYLKQQVIDKTMIILLDLQMPRMNGIEFLSHIRSEAALKETVVFVLTTSSAEEDVSRAYQENVAGYITKDNVGENFEKLINMLDGYWRVVRLPNLVKER